MKEKIKQLIEKYSECKKIYEEQQYCWDKAYSDGYYDGVEATAKSIIEDLENLEKEN